ncbi:hypothetical protein B194_4912 [Serratia plymuthica A30]|nr:hypothetical protein B194_4912 [Serratia plymuthica A30]
MAGYPACRAVVGQDSGNRLQTAYWRVSATAGITLELSLIAAAKSCNFP